MRLVHRNIMLGVASHAKVHTCAAQTNMFATCIVNRILFGCWFPFFFGTPNLYIVLYYYIPVTHVSLLFEDTWVLSLQFSTSFAWRRPMTIAGVNEWYWQKSSKIINNHQKFRFPWKTHTEAPDENTYPPVKPGKSPMIFPKRKSPNSWVSPWSWLHWEHIYYYIVILFEFYSYSIIFPSYIPLYLHYITILIGKNQAARKTMRLTHSPWRSWMSLRISSVQRIRAMPQMALLIDGYGWDMVGYDGIFTYLEDNMVIGMVWHGMTIS